MKCETSRDDSTVLSESDIETLTTEVLEWSVVEVDRKKKLERRFDFGDFDQPLRFANQVGEIAQQQKHHPAILTEWGWASVKNWTLGIGGLHNDDFIMAAKTDELFLQPGGEQ